MLERPDYTRTKWNGWGSPQKSFSLDERPGLRNYLKDTLDLYYAYPVIPTTLDQVVAPASRLTEGARRDLLSILGTQNLRHDLEARVSHALGKSYDDLVVARRGELTALPDAVLYPEGARMVREILAWASDNRAAVIPFGGGTSVVGGVAPLRGPGHEMALALDMQRMAKVLSVDPKSQTARIEAGIRGPVLEESVQAQGLTLGHFPQSFEYSTLGGWIATRSAGCYYSGARSIEDRVLRLWVETPVGPFECGSGHARATGPEIRQQLLGSEGCLGVITLAEMSLRRRPEARITIAYLLPDFERGSEVLRELAQQRIATGMTRLSDEEETEMLMALQPRPGGPAEFLRRGLSEAVRRGRGLNRPSLLIVGLEGSSRRLDRLAREVAGIVESNGGLDLGEGPGSTFDRDRYLFPYLRDALIEIGLLVETFETAGSWTGISSLRSSLRQAIVKVSEERGSKCDVQFHLAHANDSGASLNLTVLATTVPGEELKFSRACRLAVVETVLRGGWTLSHRHGIGSARVEWMMQEHGPLGVAALRALKDTLDPGGVLNPGKLLP